jgi:diguanylate cyclase (GGDEF)-like protein/PAS domain S-box-containing protein
MSGKLCLLCCENFRPELEAVVAAEQWNDVAVAAFPATCGHPPIGWDQLRPLVTEQCSQVVLLGNACLKGLAEPPQGWPPVRRLKHAECFELMAGSALVAEAIEQGAYIITPGWLADWRGRLRRMGFDETSAPGFFRDSTNELLLLDTGVDPDAARQLDEMAGVMGLPARRIAVGLDYPRLLLEGVVAEWRHAEELRRVRENEREHARELSDHLSAMDILGRLAVLTDEVESIAAIKEMFCMLFAPQEFYFVEYAGGMAQAIDRLPQHLSRQVGALEKEWAWTETGTGFLLRLSMGEEVLAVIIADSFAFPEYRDRYLNLALSVRDVCALAITNARTYRRFKEAEEANRKSEYSLKIAQAIAHLGHWEWDIQSGEMQWSDETYRILGYQPQRLPPSHDNFLLVIHPDDRERVAEHINKVQEGGSFDIEYKIVLPDGQVRIVHGMGSVIIVGRDKQPRMVGAIRDVTMPGQREVLGVIQDITERKELEWKLALEARTDALTGCANRRHFMELARHELARVRRYGGELSLLALDLDHFKSINDRFGHQVGDRTLQKLVQVCRETLREEDVVGRIGGEEFAILLPQTGEATAVEAAERLRLAVALVEVPLEDEPPLHFTTSVGVATLAPWEADIDATLARADEALYEAKHAGRNRVAVAPEEAPMKME